MQYICADIPIACRLFLYSFLDMFPLQDDIDQTAVNLNYFPAGTSVKNMQHWAQSTSSNKYQLFDYGAVRNELKYGQSSPPEIDLTHLKLVPIGLFSGDGDELADM